jgi:hypothetical protein
VGIEHPGRHEAAKICDDRTAVPDLNWYFSYNLFRLAGITQGIVGCAPRRHCGQRQATVRPRAPVPLSKDS